MRTSCNCLQCQAGCKARPGVLAVEDILFIPSEMLCASQSPGMVGVERVIVQTIVPRQKENGECVFFDKGCCLIHEHSPAGCRFFNICSEEDTPLQKEIWRKLYLDIIQDNREWGPYTETWETLPEAAPVEQRTAALQREITKAKRKKRRSMKA